MVKLALDFHCAKLWTKRPIKRLKYSQPLRHVECITFGVLHIHELSELHGIGIHGNFIAGKRVYWVKRNDGAYGVA